MDIRDLSEDEIIELITETFEEDGRIRMDTIELECVRGKPILTGRVASDEELQIIGEILTDALGIQAYENNVWVDDTLAFVRTEEAKDNVSLNMEEDNSLDTDATFGSDEEEND